MLEHRNGVPWTKTGPAARPFPSMSEPHLQASLEVLAQGLRKPLVSARAAAEELRMTATDPSSQRIGEVILQQVVHMDRMICAILDLSCIERIGLASPDSAVELL